MISRVTDSQPLHIPHGFAKRPRSWKWSRLDALCVGIFDCPHSTPKKTELGPLMARTQDISSGVFRTDQAVHVSEQTYQSRTRRAVPSFGDLLYSREGTYFGVAAEVPRDCEVCLGQRMVLIRPDRRGISHSYLRYWLNSPAMALHIHGFRDGTVAERLNLSTIRALPVLVPSHGEQKAIAEILGALDDKIELNRRMNETLESMARAIFKSWFVDFDPVRAKMDDRQPEGLTPEIAALFPNMLHHQNGELVPDGWDVEPLDNIASFLNGTALQKYPPSGENDLPVIKIAQLRKGDTAGAPLANSRLPGKFVISDGDILFSWSGTLMVRTWCGGRGALNQHLFKVTSDSYPKWFYHQWVLEHLADFQAIAASKATTMGHIQRHHLKEAMCLVPDSDLLNAGDPFFSSLHERTVANAVETRVLAGLRDTLLPKLLSGELRVPQAEKMVSEAV